MIKVKVPATSANLGPGFDTLGLALDLYLTVEACAAEKTQCFFTGEGQLQLNQTAEDNLILKAANRVFLEAGATLPGLKLKICNQIPIGKGLGSSAAAIVAGLLIGNQLLDNRYDECQLINLGAEIEGHADNIAPAMVGGLTVVMEHNNRVYYQRIDTPADLEVVIAVPDFELPTHSTRQILPEKVELHDAVANLQRTCFLMASFINDDFSRLNMAMDDIIFQPLRKRFIPGFEAVLSQARQAGANGAALSGAGPSVIAFTSSNHQPAVGEAMREAFNKNNVFCCIFSLKANKTGAEIFL